MHPPLLVYKHEPVNLHTGMRTFDQFLAEINNTQNPALQIHTYMQQANQGLYAALDAMQTAMHSQGQVTPQGQQLFQQLQQMHQQSTNLAKQIAALYHQRTGGTVGMAANNPQANAGALAQGPGQQQPVPQQPVA